MPLPLAGLQIHANQRFGEQIIAGPLPPVVIRCRSFYRKVNQSKLLVELPRDQRAPEFLPFLVLDMVVASLLMSLGMMMLPPNVVALPFKLIFFVLVDGWRLVAGSLVQGFGGT